MTPVIRASVLFRLNFFALKTKGIPIIVVKKSIPRIVPTPPD